MKAARMPAAACINDLSGVGRSSLTVAMPVLSIMGVQCCPLPTAVLSSQTGYEHFSFVDFTPYMRDYFHCWQQEKFRFDAVYTGFLGSNEQITIVREIVAALPPETMVLVDPVMADNGKVYTTYTDEMCRGMRELVRIADVITPNITEACLLTDTAYTGENLPQSQALTLCRRLAELGPKTVILTGVRSSAQTIANALYMAQEDTFTVIEKPLAVGRYPGTGDLFASVLCGGLLRGDSMVAAVDRAADFVAHTTSYTAAAGTPPVDGVLFEHCLKELL